MHEHEVNNSFEVGSKLHRLSTGEIARCAALTLLVLIHRYCEGNQ
jgi:hypothetical protein